MGTKKALTEAEALEQYRVAFENVKNQPEIAAIMAEFGYDEIVLAEGEALLTKTRESFDFNKKEDDETSEVYNNFTVKRENLETVYTLHRKKGKVVFRKDPTILKRLGLTGTLPSAYIKWLETVKKFYTVALRNGQIQTKLARLKIPLTELEATDTLITELEATRAEYLREKGESQNATKEKDKDFEEIDEWMSEFYAISKIALEDNPQLLESLGKFVRS